MFDLTEGRRSLGLLTMLLEIAYARERACRYYYPGYSLDTPSAYDYKKNFGAMEQFDWNGHWRLPPGSEPP
jgi:arginine-tRNA-protein transferase